MGKRAIISVDIQNEYFASGKLPLTGIEAATANAARIIADARARGDMVIHVHHEFPDPASPIFTPGSDGIEINALVAPIADEPVILKNHPNSFRDTNLKALLDGGDISDIVVIGAMSHMCINAIARASVDLGYGTTTIHDACATRDVEFDGRTIPAAQVHDAAMAALAFAYGEVIDTDSYLAR